MIEINAVRVTNDGLTQLEKEEERKKRQGEVKIKKG